MKLPRWISWGLPGPVARRSGTEQPERLEARNLTRGTTLASSLAVADTSAMRSKGLLGREGLNSGEGLWIVPCESVHTFGMKFAIDLVYLDRKRRIRKVRSSVPPWRISACFRAHSVMELPPGTILRSGSTVGDSIEFSRLARIDSTGILKVSED